MTVNEFEAAGPESLHGALLALWWDGQGEWQAADEIAQDVEGADGAWVHAYLHRKEGNTANATYWYGKAGKAVAGGDLRAEWEAIVGELLGT